ncbi:MAG: ABC transporter permease [Streptosporangiales bacterium]|nr:ABC transporter permease [Streptosporangiales bacterium]
MVQLFIAGGIRLTGEVSTETSAMFLQTFALGAVVPLLGLIIGTGVIGPEIDDGSILYLLGKPIRRPVIAVTKFVVGAGCVALFGALPAVISGFILTGPADDLPLAFGVATLAAGAAYVALFLMLAVITRQAAVIGLLYALVWETLIAGLIPGAQRLSVRQWALALADRLTPEISVVATVGLTVAVLALAGVTVLATAYAGLRLRSLALAGDE